MVHTPLLIGPELNPAGFEDLKHCLLLGFCNLLEAIESDKCNKSHGAKYPCNNGMIQLKSCVDAYGDPIRLSLWQVLFRPGRRTSHHVPN